MASMRKNAAAVTLGRKGGLKGGPARAAKLTPQERSASARQAVSARWAKAKKTTADTSDKTLLALLARLKETNDPVEVRQLTEQLERVIFHKQFQNV